jgi:hypothetical protein
MIEIKKNQITSDHQIFFHVDHKYDETRKFQSRIQSLQLIQCSRIITHLLSSHEAERDVKINMQFRLFADYQQRHFVSVDFIHAV